MEENEFKWKDYNTKICVSINQFIFIYINH